jgi:uncharacterized hydrophobic protein (TIGR00271 family)
MDSDAPEAMSELLRRLLAALRSRFSLVDDRATDADIDQRIRADVEMKGTNLWVLIFAIFIASIGLNVNSPAVIIGAMLISPLMGPITALGFGVGTRDLKLVRAGLHNLVVASLIALLTSAAYFAITPLHEAHSELLSRTTPTIWDVLVALFGGLAGIVAATRKRLSNVVPGVAIATALMPPLCAAGYGLAAGVWSYFFGAFYLFTINCVFIAASAALITGAFHIRAKAYMDPRLERRVTLVLWVVVAVTMLPSLYLAYQLVGEEVYRTRASLFVSQKLQFQGTRVSDVGIDPKSRRIEVSLIGNIVPPTRLAEVRARLVSAGLSGTDLLIYQAGNREIDVASLRSGLLSDLYRDSQTQSAAKDATIANLRNELGALKADSEQYRSVPAEIAAFFPQIDSVLLARAPEWGATTGYEAGDTLLLVVAAKSPMSAIQRHRLDQWLRARTGATKTQVIVQIR